MKKYLNFLLSFIMMATLITAVSCDEDDGVPDGTGTGNVSITSVSPEAEFPLQTITIEGEGFDEVQFVFIESDQLDFQLNGNLLTFVIPDKMLPSENTKITLVMAENYRVYTTFEVLLRPTPVIGSISPSTAEPGDNVTIIGTEFQDLETVSVSGIEAIVVSSTQTEIIFTIPEGPQNNASATIEIVTGGGETESESIFYVGKNIVLNGTLEEGDGDDFTNWNKFNGGADMTSSDQPYAGRSLKAIAAPGGSAWRTQFASDPTDMIVDVDYYVYMWVRAETEGGNIRFSTNSGTGALYSGNYDIGTEWEQIEWTFTNNDPASRLVLDMGASEGIVYHVDNITMVSTLSGPPPAPPININGSFEDATLGVADGVTGWGSLNGDLASGEITDEESHDGNQSLKMTINALGDNPWSIQPNSSMQVVDGVAYHLSVWFKGTGIANMKVAIDQGGTPGWAEWGNPEVGYTDGEWTELSYDFTADTSNPNDGNGRFAISMSYDGNVGGVIYIDDFSVTEIPVPPAEPININGSFEDAALGDAADVTGWGGLTGALAPGEITDEESYDGDQSLKITINELGDNPWNIQPNSPMLVVDGETYHLSIWFKGTGIANIKVAIDQGGTPGWDEWANPEVGYTDGEWTELSYDFTAATSNPNDGNGRFAISMSYDGNVGGVIYLDHLEVTLVQ